MLLEPKSQQLSKSADKTIRSWSDEELIAQVQTLAKELGRSPTYTEFSKDSRTASACTAGRRFGKWGEFLRAAGLEAKPSCREYITADELISQVQMLAKELGRTPTYREFKKDFRTASSGTIESRFRKWNNFVEAAGLKPNRLKH